MRVYVRKNFPPTGQKIIACGQHIYPKEKTGQALYGLLGLNTVYELPAGQLFFSRGDVLRTLCYTPQTKRQKFQEEISKLLYKIQTNPNKKNRLSCKPLYSSTESIMADRIAAFSNSPIRQGKFLHPCRLYYRLSLYGRRTDKFCR